jgi:hypothetical protein
MSMFNIEAIRIDYEPETIRRYFKSVICNYTLEQPHNKHMQSDAAEPRR